MNLVMRCRLTAKDHRLQDVPITVAVERADLLDAPADLLCRVTFAGDVPAVNSGESFDVRIEVAGVDAAGAYGIRASAGDFRTTQSIPVRAQVGEGTYEVVVRDARHA
jgi:hypothetical protein